MVVAISLAVIVSGVLCWAIVRGADDRDWSRSIEMDCRDFNEFMKER